MKLDIDVDKLTLGELDFFEHESGLSFTDLADGKLTTRAIMALVVLNERRNGHPEFGMEDAAGIELGSIEVVTANGRPTKAGRPRGTKASS